MSSCEEFEYLLCLRQDGALSSSEESFLQAHLQSCPACRALSDELAHIQAVFPLLQAELPDALHARMLDALQQEPAPALVFAQKTKRHVPMRRFATTAAAFVLLVSALAFWGKFSDAPLGPAPSDNPSVLAVEDGSPLASGTDETESIAPLPPISPLPDAKNEAVPSSTDKPQHIANDAGEKTKKSLEGAEPLHPTPLAQDEDVNLPLPQIDTARAKRIDRYEAAELLLEKLYADGNTHVAISLSQVDLERECFLFMCTDSKGASQSLCVSMIDGSIKESPLPEDALSPTN